MEGSGRYVYGNGDMYQGQFSAGKRQGAGTYHYKVTLAPLVPRLNDRPFFPRMNER